MARALVQLLPFEMALLGLVEFGCMFALTFMMLTSGGQALLQSTDLPRDCLVLAAMLALTIAGTAATIGLYRPEVCLDRRRFLLCGTIAALLAFPAILMVSGAYRMTMSGEHVVWLARLLAIWLPFVLLVRLGLSAVAARMPVTRRVLIIGNGPRAMQLRRRLTAKRHGLFEPMLATGGPATDGPATGGPATDGPATGGPATGGATTAYAPAILEVAGLKIAGPKVGGLKVAGLEAAGEVRNEGPDAAPARRFSAHLVRERRIWGIVIADDEPAPEIHAALLHNKLRGIPVYSDLSFQEHHLGRIELDAIDTNWLLFADGFQNGAMSRAAKRTVDVAVGLVLTIVTLPLMLVTAAAIKLDSRGPAFYRQERTGLHGETFTLFKFRSMAIDAEVAGKPQWAAKRDPRVTRVGAIMRASRIDELPQLFNVLRGEMSMIGPRPERPIFVDELARVIPFYNHRGYVKPGLTGWAQVNYPYGASVDDAREKLAYDLYYVKNRGVLLDLVILLATIRVILFREGGR
jgi:lipopolysaccharide/colanic/teichoic acid biosynthesis glycosyltransferase